MKAPRFGDLKKDFIFASNNGIGTIIEAEETGSTRKTREKRIRKKMEPEVIEEFGKIITSRN